MKVTDKVVQHATDSLILKVNRPKETAEMLCKLYTQAEHGEEAKLETVHGIRHTDDRFYELKITFEVVKVKEPRSLRSV